MKRPSLKLRITGWFALMMFVIEALVLAFLLAVNGTVATNDPEARLVRMVEHNANRVKYNNRQFRFSRIHYNRSGVYTVLYDADGNVLDHEVNHCSMSPDFEGLLKVPHIILVSGGMAKVPILQSVLRRGYVHVFVTDARTAHSLLNP